MFRATKINTKTHRQRKCKIEGHLLSGWNMLQIKLLWENCQIVMAAIWVCLKMSCTPLYPMVLLIIIPFLNGYFIGNIYIYPTFSLTNPYDRVVSYHSFPPAANFSKIVLAASHGISKLRDLQRGQ